MTKEIKDLRNKTDSKSELLWRNRIMPALGLLLLVLTFIPVILSWYIASVEEVVMSWQKWGIVAFAFFCIFGSKSFGIVANNIGIGISNYIKKITN